MHAVRKTVVKCINDISVRGITLSARNLTGFSNSSDTDGNIIPGPERSSDWWPHQPRAPGRRIARMYPVRFRHRPRIVIVREGCTNRPFFTIQVKSNLAEAKQQGIEQVGSWDPFPNKIYGEQLVALNLDRISYWLARGAEPSTRVAELLGIAGVLPVHPRSYLVAHRARSATAAYTEEQKATIAPAPTTEDAETEQNTGDQPPEPNPISRPDSVWRRGREPPWWWFTGLT